VEEEIQMSRQTEIPGTEVPKNPDIERSIDQWLESKDEQKYATEKTKLRHSTLLLHMQTAGIDVYPFLDPKTGKKKQIVIARDPKAKTLKQPRWNRRDKDAEDDVGEEVEVTDVSEETPAVDNKVEKRRVSRASVEQEIDPFASTRRALDDDSAAAELDAIGGSYAEKMAVAFGADPAVEIGGGAESVVNGETPKKKGKRSKS
jgi:hypothetical protein